MSTLALIGNLALDRIAGGTPRAGGGVFHGARAAAHVGADAVVVTRCAGRDREVALAPLEATGVPVLCTGASRGTLGLSSGFRGTSSGGTDERPTRFSRRRIVDQ